MLRQFTKAHCINFRHLFSVIHGMTTAYPPLMLLCVQTEWWSLPWAWIQPFFMYGCLCFLSMIWFLVLNSYRFRTKFIKHGNTPSSDPHSAFISCRNHCRFIIHVQILLCKIVPLSGPSPRKPQRISANCLPFLPYGFWKYYSSLLKYPSGFPLIWTFLTFPVLSYCMAERSLLSLQVGKAYPKGECTQCLLVYFISALRTKNFLPSRNMHRFSPSWREIVPILWTVPLLWLLIF